MDIAILTAQRSEATRAKVGVVFLDSNDELVATGYNGTVRGFHTNVPEKIVDGHVVTDEEICIHAEQNGLMHAARRGISLRNGSAVVTMSPCTKCTALMIQAGIKKVWYNEEHRTLPDVERLYRSHIDLFQYYRS